MRRALILLGIFTVCAPSAQAAFPGSNGKIVFTSDEGAFVRQLFTMQSDGSRRTRIAAQGEDPAWSSDGTKVAYATPGNVSPGGLPQLGF